MWRSESEMLEVVVARAAARRRRRQRAGLTTAVTTILAVALVSAAVRGGAGRPVNVASAGGSTGAPTTLAPSIPGVPFPFADPPTTVADRPVSTIPTPSTSPATTIPPNQPSRTTTGPGTDATTTTTAPPPPLCGREVVAYIVVTDKAVYQLGEVVRATATLRNIGTQACYGPSAQLTAFEDATGRHLLGMGSHADCFLATPCGPVLAPGQTQSASMCWDQQADGSQVPPGDYGVRFSLSEFEGRASFEIVGSPSLTPTTRPPGYLTLC